MSRRILIPAVFAPAVFLCLVLLPEGEYTGPVYAAGGKTAGGPDRVLVTDGSTVHDVGNLHLHVANWGLIGSFPSASLPFSGAPSAEWPAGGGVEHLYAGGLWVGALKGGVPAVSTAAYDFEFRPTTDPVDVMYEAAEGDPGGKRIPDPNADDDGDGRVDEEWLDGRDNDGDGLIDEDYAAVSDQMLSCWYTDDQPEAIQIYPDHNPLHVTVHQRSYQWIFPAFDDFVALDYTIVNTGQEVLEEIYLGMFIDGDVGNRNTPNYWEDDATGYETAPMECTPYGGSGVSFGYVYDADGDGGNSPGACGVLLLDHPTDPTGQLAPEAVGFNTYAVFTGNQPYEDGGDPTNDFERYELMASRSIERDNAGPQDVRFLVSVGPFAQLAPGESMVVRMAVFAGDFHGGGLAALRQSAVAAKLVFEGRWYDLDANPTTGVAGRETPVFGPATDVPVDTCAVPPVIIPYLPPREVAWIDSDCAEEGLRESVCGWGPGDSLLVLTGVAGKESQVNWMLPEFGPSPVLISGFAARSSGTAAELSWRVDADEPIAGFRLVRTSAGGPAVTIPGAGALLPPETRRYVDGDVLPGRSYAYALLTVLSDGTELLSYNAGVTVPAGETRLYANKPNPFNPITTIAFDVAERQPVDLAVFSAGGARVATLLDETVPAGRKEVRWDGRNEAGDPVGSGIYFYRLKAGKTTISRKMVLLK